MHNLLDKTIGDRSISAFIGIKLDIVYFKYWNWDDQSWSNLVVALMDEDYCKVSPFLKDHKNSFKTSIKTYSSKSHKITFWSSVVLSAFALIAAVSMGDTDPDTASFFGLASVSLIAIGSLLSSIQLAKHNNQLSAFTNYKNIIEVCKTSPFYKEKVVVKRDNGLTKDNPVNQRTVM